MKFRLIAAALAALLVLTGCRSMEGDAIENKMDSLEDTIESKVENMVTPNQAVITDDEAESIALEHAGFSPEQVSYLRSEYEVDDGVPQYEVHFHQGTWEYDYEIHAQTGEIISFDKGD